MAPNMAWFQISHGSEQLARNALCPTFALTLAPSGQYLVSSRPILEAAMKTHDLSSQYTPEDWQ